MPRTRMRLFLIFLFCSILVGCAGMGGRNAQPLMLNQAFSLSNRDKTRLIDDAAAGDAAAAYRLALYYDLFVGNTADGTHWLRIASQLGHADAQYALGTRLRMNKDTALREEGLLWLEKGAATGHVLARERLNQIASGRNPAL